MADLVICCSDIAARSYVAAGIGSDRVVVNPLGCDVARFASVARSVEGAPKFCFVGTASETKGFGDLLAAFHAHRDRFPAAELHIVGDRRTAIRFGAFDGHAGITLHGKKSHRELAALLAGMDVLLLPSVLDSFGLVVPEALAAGMFVVVSDMVGAGMMIDDNRMGTVLNRCTRGALIDEMNRIAGQLGRIRDDGGFRRRRAEAYDWSRYRERSITLLRSLCSA
jgi:glycosyltransferase involved in cell wall biosynthesis